jgi:hypothetical protein
LFVLRVLLLLLISVLLIACGDDPPPTPTAIVTPVTMRRAIAKPTATAIATPTATPIPWAQRAQKGDAMLAPFTLPLPAEWQHIIFDGADRGRFLDLTGQVNPSMRPLVQPLLAQSVAPQPLAIAWPSPTASTIGLVAYTMPRDTLTLPRYVAAVEGALRTASSVTVHEATVLYRLHADVPVGYLHYTLTGSTASPVDSHTYLLFSADASQLLLLSFVTASEPVPVSANPISVDTVDSAVPPFGELVQQVRLE